MIKISKYQDRLNKSLFWYDRDNDTINEKYPSPNDPRFILPRHFRLHYGIKYIQFFPYNPGVDKNAYIYKSGVWYYLPHPTHLIDKRAYPSRFKRSDDQERLQRSGYENMYLINVIVNKYPPFSSKAVVPTDFDAPNTLWWCNNSRRQYEYHHHKWYCDNAHY